MNEIFSKKVINWYDKFGRKNLPWQGSNSYHVWVSEIMLQQTQVIKVIDYFQNFIQQFPTLKALAESDIDNVLSSWSGLGYYNRARNLHKSAQICLEKYNACLPVDITQLLELPGIGRTTAGAILSLASDLPYPILDGNVKRIISRLFTINAEKTSELNRKLWDCVTNLMPKSHCRKYNQALMDLGSLICTRSSPKCKQCPLINKCKAYQKDLISLYPQKNKKTKQIKKTYHLLMMVNQNKIFLEQRESHGIWPQLWFLPMYNSEQELLTIALNRFNINHNSFKFNIQHILTHRKLDLQVHCYSNVSIIEKNINNHNKWVNISNYTDLPHPTSLVKIIHNYLANEIN